MPPRGIERMQMAAQAGLNTQRTSSDRAMSVRQNTSKRTTTITIAISARWSSTEFIEVRRSGSSLRWVFAADDELVKGSHRVAPSSSRRVVVDDVAYFRNGVVTAIESTIDLRVLPAALCG
jgi:hypothetical protein